MKYGRPIIGVAGGIGSGKSYVARLFGEMGCKVIDSDRQVSQAYDDPGIRQALLAGWGPEVFLADGSVNRKELARRVFSSDAERSRLEQLLHPWVGMARDREMAQFAEDSAVVAFVWDTPLLFETGLNDQCDAVVFIETPIELRQSRVSQTRGWTVKDLESREKKQMPLDKKRKLSEYIVTNTAEAESARSQVREVLSRILVEMTRNPAPNAR